MHGPLDAIDEYGFIMCIKRKMRGQSDHMKEPRSVTKLIRRRDSSPWLYCDHTITILQKRLTVNFGVDRGYCNGV